MNRQASTARTALNTSPKKAAEYEEVNCTIFPISSGPMKPPS